ncbi:MAG: spore germination protein [Clostridiaceae bacterium]|jgi:spore germination protein KA|nr:spore germination protein [Clostridiaceae bacterium]
MRVRRKCTKTEKTLQDPGISQNQSNGSTLNSGTVKEILQVNSDVAVRNLFAYGNEKYPVTMVFVDGLANITLIDESILKPITRRNMPDGDPDIHKIFEDIEHGTFHHVIQKTRENLSDCIQDILDGSVALIFDQVEKAITFDVKEYEKRSITEPTGENVIKGAKDSFIENLRTNTATVRRKVRNSNLVIEETQIGRQTITRIAVVYLKDIANRHTIEKIRKRINSISTDGVLTSGVIEENIIDRKYSPFPQVVYTERPDKFCANIVEGRIGIIVDGFPLSFILPVTLESFVQAPEDYSQNFIVSSVIRFMRFLLILVTLLLPGLYVSITTFHHEMIPTELALVITSSKQGVPFPSFVEVIFMLIAFEVLVEAGLRLPKTIGQAVSIVGAVVVGEAAVQARLVSPTVVVTIATTAIASFTMPNQDFSNALRLWRFIFVVLSSMAGLFGLSLGGILLLDHLSSMEVYGISYLSPLAGEDEIQLQDSIFRFPYRFQKNRPVSLRAKNKKRVNQ